MLMKLGTIVNLYMGFQNLKLDFSCDTASSRKVKSKMPNHPDSSTFRLFFFSKFQKILMQYIMNVTETWYYSQFIYGLSKSEVGFFLWYCPVAEKWHQRCQIFLIQVHLVHFSSSKCQSGTWRMGSFLTSWIIMIYDSLLVCQIWAL